MNERMVGWEWPDLQPMEQVIADMRRAMGKVKECMQLRSADDDGSLSELDAVLRLKRGCRR